MAVYFARSGVDGPIKIGRAKNPRMRIMFLQQDHPYDLKPIRIIEDCEDRVETLLHWYFKHLHIRREWYKFVPDMLTVTVEELLTAEREAHAICTYKAQSMPEVRRARLTAHYLERDKLDDEFPRPPG